MDFHQWVYKHKAPTTIDEAYDLIFEYRKELSYRKNRDYGKGNIAGTGLHGIAVRLYDKASRLFNLITQGRDPAVNDESTDDTLVDASNYGDIGLMLKYDWWKLPWDETKHGEDQTQRADGDAKQG